MKSHDRFRLMIHVTRGCTIARILKKMYSGQRIVFDNIQDACEAQAEWMALASAVIIEFGSDEVFGMTAVADQRDHLLHNSRLISKRWPNS